jgi:hypothetical protein
VNIGVDEYGVGEYWLLSVQFIQNISKHFVGKNTEDFALNLSLPLLTAKLPAYLI